MVSLHTENVQQSFSFALPSNVPTNQHFDLYSATDDELTETNNFITQQVIILQQNHLEITPQ